MKSFPARREREDKVSGVRVWGRIYTRQESRARQPSSHRKGESCGSVSESRLQGERLKKHIESVTTNTPTPSRRRVTQAHRALRSRRLSWGPGSGGFSCGRPVMLLSCCWAGGQRRPGSVGTRGGEVTSSSLAPSLPSPTPDDTTQKPWDFPGTASPL